jgi:hypothetical protein
VRGDRAFWRWFEEHEDELFRFDPTNISERERLFDELVEQLAKCHDHLAFEFGPPEQLCRQFVISANGDRSLFPVVLRLVGSAPKLKRWKVMAFRPRQDPHMAVSVNGITVSPEEVEFSLLSNGVIAGIQVFIPGMTEDDMPRKQIAYLLLDTALGEYDVETKLGLIEVLSPSSSTEAERFPFSLLPEMFDELVASLPNGA